MFVQFDSLFLENRSGATFLLLFGLGQFNDVTWKFDEYGIPESDTSVRLKQKRTSTLAMLRATEEFTFSMK